MGTHCGTPKASIKCNETSLSSGSLMSPWTLPFPFQVKREKEGPFQVVSSINLLNLVGWLRCCTGQSGSYWCCHLVIGHSPSSSNNLTTVVSFSGFLWFALLLTILFYCTFLVADFSVRVIKEPLLSAPLWGGQVLASSQLLMTRKDLIWRANQVANNREPLRIHQKEVFHYTQNFVFLHRLKARHFLTRYVLNKCKILKH